MNRLREVRKEKSLTLNEVGKQLGLKNNTLSQYETGKREPKLETWQKLASFFEVPIPYLQGLTISKDDAINTLINWLNGSLGYDNFNMQVMLNNWLIEVGENKKTISEAKNNIEIARKLIIKHLPIITRPVFLARFTKNDLNNGVFENEIAGIVGSSDEKAKSIIDSTRFSDNEEQNFKIQVALENVIDDIYMNLSEKERRLNQRITKIENILSKLKNE